jgi:hypothetical protein
LAEFDAGNHRTMSEPDKEAVKPTEQHGGSTPNEAELREKGSWAATARDGIVPPELGGSDAPRELLGEDPQLGSSVLGETTGSDEPATEEGVNPAGGDHADATSDGGPEVPAGAEPDLKDAASLAVKTDPAEREQR